MRRFSPSQLWRSVLLASFCAVQLSLSAAFAQDRSPQPSPTSLIGSWTGTYVCTQGQTGLTVAITGQEGENFIGYFHFYPLASNTRAKEGCYTIRGRIDARRQFTIEAVRWITQPENYVTVDLAGVLDVSGRILAGNIVAPGPEGVNCTTFELQSQVPAPKIAAVCYAGVVGAPSVSVPPLHLVTRLQRTSVTRVSVTPPLFGQR